MIKIHVFNLISASKNNLNKLPFLLKLLLLWKLYIEMILALCKWLCAGYVDIGVCFQLICHKTMDGL